MANPIWNTASGSIGTFPSLIPISFQLSAVPVAPATTLTYNLISGSLPTGVSLSLSGLISGIPAIESQDTTFEIVVRAIDNLNNIKDRYFSLVISGAAGPSFITPTGNILNSLDSTWIELPIEYNNPISTNPVQIRVVQGLLPPGLEINENGLIRGYAEPPTILVNLPIITGYITASNGNEETLTCLSTVGFTPGRPIIFSGTEFGGLNENQTYYIKSIIDGTNFTISTTADGPTYNVLTDIGYMTFILPTVTVGQPTVRTYSFTLKLESPLGNDIEAYYITVINQNAPITQGGPGLPDNSRIPTIYNTRPPTYNIENSPNFDYYILPSGPEYYPGETYPINVNAYIGQIFSGDFFSFKVLGHDFDNNVLEYIYADLPLGLVGDPVTGWITGVPVISENNINQFNFSVAVRKTNFPAIASPFFNFSFRISNNIDGDIVWISSSDLGQILNNTISTKKVVATSDVALSYRIVGGSLPPNLTLLSNGEITGAVAFQPNDILVEVGDITTFTFTVEAYSPEYFILSSTKTFTIEVLQEFNEPTDTLYMKCTPSISDRLLIDSLLQNEEIIPPSYIYRSEDIYFGKATSVIYEHAYGIYASNFDEYVEAVMKNHYNRNITLGEIKTAIARDENNEIIYEVVYSEIIDDLINPQGISVDEEIYWPRFIDLNLGPWYTSVTNIYTSYISGPIQQYYTSLTPGYARTLYPNSLPNMRERVGQELGQEYNFKLYPAWMTSQQLNGSTLGFVPAWVICYTKPGYAEIVKNNIETKWVDVLGRPYKLNTINFQLDRFTVDKSLSYNYDKNLDPAAWTGLPSATPAPDPIDSKDFYVLFPRKTILPNSTQY